MPHWFFPPADSPANFLPQEASRIERRVRGRQRKRKRGVSECRGEAEDLAQEFFASRIVTKRVLRDLQPDASRFRSWLLTSLQNMVKYEWEKARAVERGGTQPHVPLDFQSAEGRYVAEPAHNLTLGKPY